MIQVASTMADALAPWFLGYILSIAETYGANISNVPSNTKRKKVQITEASSRNIQVLTAYKRHV